MTHPHDEMDSLLHEQRRFPPPAGFAANAHVSDESVYAEAEADPEGWWAGCGGLA